MKYWRKWCKERTRWMRIKSLPVSIDNMTRCYFSINFYALSSSCCCIILAKLLSLMIMFFFFSRFCILYSISYCIAKASRAYLEIAALFSGGLEMEIGAYNSWGELIYRLFGTDLLRSIFVLFSAVRFENLSSLGCNNAARIASLLVAGQHLSRYRSVTLNS